MKRIITSINYIIPIFFAVSLILGIYGAVVNKANTLPVPWLIVPVGAALAFLLAVKLNGLEKYAESMTVYEYRRFSALLCLILLISQILSTVFVNFTPINDLKYVADGAENLILGRELYYGLPEYHQDYFECYPNNHALFTIIYMLYKVQFEIFGKITNVLPTILNIIALNMSYWLMCRCAELVHTTKKAFLCAVRGMLFTPFVTYAANFYTDSMAMPLVMLSVYIYLKNRKSGRLSQLVICGAVMGLAFKMKGSSGVLLIAVIIDMLLQKRKVTCYGALVLPFAAAAKTVSAISAKLLGITCEMLKEKAFPLIHWIMMSADGRGGYNSEDFLYTQSFSGCDKVSADLARLSLKLKTQGFFGFIWHLADKIAYTWENFTFMAGYYCEGSFSSPVFIVTAFLCHWTVVFSLLINLWQSRKKGSDEAFLFRLSLFGLCAFLLIWETRCRYLISFFPVFLLI
ncbi:MAG: glycosyltransferase family 39 protein [Ruminococcus sp.]|nr:glycosyltransferase family 39 protein [Ruminococcus sp.]